MKIPPIGCPMCGAALDLFAALPCSERGAVEAQLLVGLTAEARAHVRSHFPPDDDGGEPMPLPVDGPGELVAA